MKNEKLIIVGKSGSGKDYLRRKLIEKELRYQPKITTRPKRKLETDEYEFLTNEDFQNMVKSNLIKVNQSFIINENIWNYAISNDNWNNNQIFIMTPNELNQLSKEDRNSSFVVYLDIDYETRLSRLNRRNDISDSIKRRLDADEEDFRNFSDYDLKIGYEDYDIDMIYDLMY